MASGRSSLAVTPHASAARTASGTGSAVDCGIRSFADLTLNITAVSGTATPTLAVTLETSDDGTNWVTAVSFNSAAAVGVVRKRLANGRRYIRAKWTITGTNPSFTFDLSGTSQIAYATLEDLGNLGMAATALSAVSEDVKAQHLLNASAELDIHHEAARFVLPLASWGTGLRQRTASVAAWTLLAAARGFNPEGNADQAIRLMRDDAIKAAKAGMDPEITDATPEVDEAETYVVSESSRGW
jgi:phage gp36-like protein